VRGYVYQRGRTYTIVYDEARREDGKRQQRTLGGFKTKREAQDALTKKLHAIGAGSYVEPSKTTLGEYLTGEWLPSIQSSVRPATYATYASLVRTHIVKRRLGQQRLQALNPAQLKTFYAELEQAGLAAETRRLIHSVLHKSLSDAVGWDKLVRNPVERVRRPQASGRRATAWTAGELRRFLARAETDRLSALWRLCATTGMRRGECLGVDWRSVNLDAGTLSVTRQLLATGAFGPPKSERSERTITLDLQTVETLKRHREAQLVERALAGDAYEDGDLVFCDGLGAPIPPNRLSEQFMRLRKAAGIPTGSMHILRHTHATLMLTAQVVSGADGEDEVVPAQPVHVVAARLGDRPETILRTYAHLLPRSDEAAAKGMAALLVAV
jgi:integrase